MKKRREKKKQKNKVHHSIYWKDNGFGILRIAPSQGRKKRDFRQRIFKGPTWIFLEFPTPPPKIAAIYWLKKTHQNFSGKIDLFVTQPAFQSLPASNQEHWTRKHKEALKKYGIKIENWKSKHYFLLLRKTFKVKIATLQDWTKWVLKKNNSGKEA